VGDDVRGGHLGGLAARSLSPGLRAWWGVRCAQECAVEGGPHTLPARCAQTGRTTAYRCRSITASRRSGYLKDLARSHRALTPGHDAGDEPTEGYLPKAGDPLRGRVSTVAGYRDHSRSNHRPVSGTGIRAALIAIVGTQVKNCRLVRRRCALSPQTPRLYRPGCSNCEPDP
jgi:hypothetical protein